MAKRRKRINAGSAIIIFSLVMVNVILWHSIISDGRPQTPRAYSFSLTHSTSTLLILPNNITILVDAGGDDTILGKLDAVLPPTNDHYIDLAIISYPQLDHYEGYDYILDHDTVGAFVYNGRNDPADTKEWTALLEKIHAKHVPMITLGEGDSIKYGTTEIDIVSPNSVMARSANITDTAVNIVLYNNGI